MSALVKYKKSKLKYKGQMFLIHEVDLECKLPGVRRRVKGINQVLLNTKLPKRKKQLEFHRLLTGRGLRDMETHKPVKYV